MPRKTSKTIVATNTDALVETLAPDTAPPVELIVPPKKKKAAAKPAAKPRAAKASPTPVDAAPVSQEPAADQVAHEAYLLWLADGQPVGKDVEHWLVAEQIVRSRLSLLAAAVHTA